MSECFRQGVYSSEEAYVRTTPRECGHTSRLCNKRGSNFVAKSVHGGCWRAQEENAPRQQRVWELGVLGCVTPSWPHGLHPCSLRNLQDNPHRLTLTCVHIITCVGLQTQICPHDQLPYSLHLVKDTQES